MYFELTKMISKRVLMMRQHSGFCSVVVLFLLYVVPVSAQEVPPAGESGLQPKLLEQSQPRFQPPAEQIPDIHIEGIEKGKPVSGGATLTVRSIRVEGATRIETSDLESQVNRDGGFPREMTFGELLGLSERITAYYADQGFLLARSYIPRQEVKDGVVVIRVQEGKVTGLSSQGQSRYEADDLLQWLSPVVEEESPRTSTLERALLELNDTLGLEVKSSIRRGIEPGSSELVLEVKESRPYSFSFDADNFGSRFTGRNRFGITGMMGSVLKLGDQVSVRAIRSSGEQNFVNFAYSIPVTRYGTDLRFSYVYADHQLGSTLAHLNGSGETHIASIGVSHPLHRTRTARLNLNGGVEGKLFNNYLLNEKTTNDDLLDAYIGIDGFFLDSLRGRTFYNVRAQFGFTEKNVTDSLNSRLMGRGDAIVGSARITRYQSAWFFDSYFVLKAMGQLSSKRVLSPDLFAAGGIGTVRGFNLSELTGDHAVALTLEYVLPVPLDIPMIPKAPAVRRPISVFGFIDYARVFVEDPQPGEGDAEITGAGGGLRLNTPKAGNFPAISFTVAWGTSVLGSQKSEQDPNGILYLGGQIQF